MYFGIFSPVPSIFNRENTMSDRRAQLRSRRFPEDAITRRPQTFRTFPRTTLYVHLRRGHTFARSESALLARNNISRFPFRIFSPVVPKFPEKSIPLNNQTRRSEYVFFYSYHYLYAFSRFFL